ncbi:hypothetical protein GYMLUDRAFT_40474 [Collybiopsis luxurians FD-317 M1]|uniref:Zinc/iron permease n=1 Tax=Collybiopsis luxurians FD-317 M1 TaxID=944289 RepID=A0A0D0D4A2_9AGAR|nr:hypothetical protein GYMLUDRAFT_40474 [Collybiopsis luxurians FD-317 M1]
MEFSDPVVEHLGAMAIIFVISLLAVSFPAVSRKIRFLSIPKLVFFIGKHFGTGVILATAFGHLLQDSFEALTSSTVKESYPGIGEQTGFIILASLVAIFLVEYVSTSYVDHLHENTSPNQPSHLEEQSSHSHPRQIDTIDENTPLLTNTSFSQHSQHSHPPTPSKLHRSQSHYLSSVVTNSPRHSRSNDYFYIINDVNYHLNNGEYHLVGGGSGPCVCVCVCPAARLKDDSTSQGGIGNNRRSKLVIQSPEDAGRATANGTGAASPGREGDAESQKQLVSRKRQVVGILVLQLGIMIHSLVIGLTISITSGSEFTSLVTAIIFHQLFEGLSLGIRIAAIPPADSDSSSLSSSRLSLPSKAPLSASDSSRQDSKPHRSFLQPVLTFLFAITTPFGIGLGMLVFNSKGRSNASRMLLTQGLMSAISAGMLIYAATVEMMAGDFVFGNLGGGGGGHGHDHGGHSHGSEFIEASGSNDEAHRGQDDGEEGEEGVSLKRRMLAVASLLAGVLAMGLIALGE